MTAESNYYGGKGILANLGGKYVTAVEFAQLVEAVQALQTTVGGSSSGLAKDVADLQTIVGDSSSGLVKRVADLEAD